MVVVVLPSLCVRETTAVKVCYLYWKGTVKTRAVTTVLNQEKGLNWLLWY